MWWQEGEKNKDILICFVLPAVAQMVVSFLKIVSSVGGLKQIMISSVLAIVKLLENAM